LPNLQAKGRLLTVPTPKEAAAKFPSQIDSNKPKYMVRPPKPALPAEASTALRDKLLSAIAQLTTADQLAKWAHENLPSKNTLIAADARATETAYQAVLDTINDPTRDVPTDAALDDKPKNVSSDAPAQESKPTIEAPRIADAANSARLNEVKDDASPPKMLIGRTVRRRNKAHRLFVAAQPCLICGKSPRTPSSPICAAARVAPKSQRRIYGCYVRPSSDLHHRGNEIDWWGDIDPTKVSGQLWRQTLNVTDSAIDRSLTSNTIKSSFRKS
jgi:hypothetical protein